MAAELDNMEQPNNNNGPWDPPEPPRGWDDPAATAKIFECSRIKALADERDAVQKKTFTKWVNAHLARAALRVGDLYSDLRDGFALTRLLELLSGEQLPKPTRGRMRIHSLENVDKALQFLKEQRVHLENVGSHDIVDGNHRLTLGLIWTIILRFQIQVIKIKTEDNRETRSAKDALLLWCQMKTAGYPEVNIQNFTTSWRDGLAFNALIHRHRPDLIDFHKLTKSNATYNLQQAFNTAEQQLGLSKLLDPEDVNMEDPDEKSIITYVVSFYHYFSKMKALAVEGKRIGKVLDQAMEVEAIAGRYEALAAELLAWIHHTVAVIANQKFANSLSGVQQQLQAFTAFCTLEKPVKFQEKGNLEVLLFTIQSKLRANNRKLYVPSEGKSISDINKAWSRLEKAEHEREAALRNELIRQEKLELLAQRFDHKVAMRETWLNENQRLVSQDNFGYDLPAVEAAMKKHEAIEADISSYHERIQVVVELAVEMESEGYYDTKRIGAQKDNVLRQWGLLTQLLRARRARLEQNLALQKIFQEMVYMIDWMEEMQALLVSKEPGKHLLEAEDLLQKHGLLEADIAAQTERVRALNAAALRFSELEGYQPCDPPDHPQPREPRADVPGGAGGAGAAAARGAGGLAAALGLLPGDGGGRELDPREGADPGGQDLRPRPQQRPGPERRAQEHVGRAGQPAGAAAPGGQEGRAAPGQEALQPRRHPGEDARGAAALEEAGGGDRAAPAAPAGGARLLPVQRRDGRPGGLAAGHLPPGVQRRLRPRRALHAGAAAAAPRAAGGGGQAPGGRAGAAQAAGAAGARAPARRGRADPRGGGGAAVRGGGRGGRAAAAVAAGRAGRVPHVRRGARLRGLAGREGAVAAEDGGARGAR
ncbi:hypothetical protein Q9966_016707 [Columba livia]|nr:hypothetical protein Q9966_016707 [Columba livia]